MRQFLSQLNVRSVGCEPAAERKHAAYKAGQVLGRGFELRLTVAVSINCP